MSDTARLGAAGEAPAKPRTDSDPTRYSTGGADGSGYPYLNFKHHSVKVPAQRRPLSDTLFEEGVEKVYSELQQVLLSKHRDYGPSNIADAPGGPLYGLQVRIHDKVARINHLLDKEVGPENESLEDSFLDLANYAAIAVLVLRKQWPTGGKR